MFVKEDIVEMPVKTASGILIPGRKAIIDATEEQDEAIKELNNAIQSAEGE